MIAKKRQQVDYDDDDNDNDNDDNHDHDDENNDHNDDDDFNDDEDDDDDENYVIAYLKDTKCNKITFKFVQFSLNSSFFNVKSTMVTVNE